MSNTTLKPCRFYFGDDPTFEGFTDGTTWNGFDNVWVTPEVHKQIIQHFEAECRMLNYSNVETIEQMKTFNIEPDDDGLISYAMGFATSIDDHDQDPLDVIAEVIADWREGLNLDDPDFDDKELQQQRQSQYDRAVSALNDLRPLKKRA